MVLSTRVPEEVARAVEQAAYDDRRRIGSLLAKVLTEWLEQHGYLKPRPKPKR